MTRHTPFLLVASFLAMLVISILLVHPRTASPGRLEERGAQADSAASTGHQRRLTAGRSSRPRSSNRYPVNWKSRYHREHAHVQRLLRRLQRAHARAREIQAHTQRPAHYNEWLCIHQYEGAWNANTGNGYYGGLQMDITFQRTYGPELLAAKGTADRWTPLEQMTVAERAWRVRGFNPWPNTARKCGLL